MILYIIYFEPLLINLEKSLSGLKLSTVRQTLEAYCDDINIVTNHLEDFARLEQNITNKWSNTVKKQ